MQLIFASHNENKVREIAAMLPKNFQIKSLKEINWELEIPETFDTLEGNARLKAHTVYLEKGVNCFADDTGLEIDALDGEPGVWSARYAGEESSSEANMNLVLDKMKDMTNRRARFRTVIALILNGEEKLFEGIVEGNILYEKRGTGGFGYDPIFKPLECNQTFAEMSQEEKGIRSHRGKAIAKLKTYLEYVSP